MYKIPFNKAILTGKELEYIQEAVANGHISGDGEFTRRCSALMENAFQAKKVFLTPSCTASLEMAALLLNPEEGDEVLLPSFAFVSTVNAFVLQGMKPVFVDIRPDTLNIDEARIEEKITPRTRAMVALHYAGVGCEMDALLEISRRKEVPIVEDAAHAVNAKYKGKHLGTFGEIGAYSFHETKNYTCGEGGAVVLNRENIIERAEFLRQKGTNRNQFFRGMVDKYTWVDVGSSYVLSDILAAFLLAQLENMDAILEKRGALYATYIQEFSDLEAAGKLRLPVIPDYCDTSYHLFHLLFDSEETRNHVMDGLRKEGILAVFHFVPLHLSAMGKRYGYRAGDFPITEDYSSRLLRLPLYNSLTVEEVQLVASAVKKLL